MSLTYSIRPERQEDQRSIRALNDAAFGQPQEGRLVDRLRQELQAWRSWVAEVEGSVVGHVLFTPVSVSEGDGEWPAVALGPMAVRPDLQRQGIGSALVRAGLEEVLGEGERVVFVLGHPDYYPRFGFVPAPPRGLTCKWPVPDDVFMVAELEVGALKGRRGRVRYDSAFDDV